MSGKSFLGKMFYQLVKSYPYCFSHTVFEVLFCTITPTPVCSKGSTANGPVDSALSTGTHNTSPDMRKKAKMFSVYIIYMV